MRRTTSYWGCSPIWYLGIVLIIAPSLGSLHSSSQFYDVIYCLFSGSFISPRGNKKLSTDYEIVKLNSHQKDDKGFPHFP